MEVVILLVIYLVECVPNKMDNANINVFNMITRISELKTLTKYICGCKCKIDDTKCNSNQKWNKEFCQCECKNPIKHIHVKKIVWNPSTCGCKTAIKAI